MGAFRRLQHGLVPGVITAGLLALPAGSVRAGSYPASASISAVASVENPVGAARLDDLRFSTAISDLQTIGNISSRAGDSAAMSDRLLLYSPSPDIYIAIASVDNAPVEFLILPTQANAGCPAIAGGDGLRMELLDLTPAAAAPHAPRLTITLIPTGY